MSNCELIEASAGRKVAASDDKVVKTQATVRLLAMMQCAHE